VLNFNLKSYNYFKARLKLILGYLGTSLGSKKANVSRFYKNFMLYIIRVRQFLVANFALFFSEKPISSRRYYSTSARIRTCRCPPISSIKQHKQWNFVRLQFQFLVFLHNAKFGHSMATITKTWRKFYLSHKFAIADRGCPYRP